VIGFARAVKTGWGADGFFYVSDLKDQVFSSEKIRKIPSNEAS
jgi:hypothetical protein